MVAAFLLSTSKSVFIAGDDAVTGGMLTVVDAVNGDLSVDVRSVCGSKIIFDDHHSVVEGEKVRDVDLCFA